MRTLAIVALVFVGLVAAMPAAPSKPRTYSEDEIGSLMVFSEQLERARESDILDGETSVRIGEFCILHSDCPVDWRCENLLTALGDMVNATSHASELPRLQRKAKVHGKECVRSISDFFKLYKADELADRLKNHVDQINEVLEGELGVAKYGLDMSKIRTINVDYDPRSSMQRVGELAQFSPPSILYLLFALRGKEGNPTIDDSLLLLLSLSSVQQPGQNVDNNMFNNPFLLYILLGNQNMDSNKNVLLYSLLLSPNGGLGGGSHLNPANTFSNPLILLSLLEKNNNNMNIRDLLPLLIGGGGLGGGAGGINSILPLLLLSSNSSSGLGDDKLLLLLLSGGLGGAPGGDPNNPAGGLGGIEQILPLLLSGDSGLGGGSSGSLNEILPLLLLGGGGLGGAGGGAGGLASILPLLLSGQNSIGSDNNFLTLLLLSGGLGGGAGGLGGILPLLLLRNSTSLGGDNDMLSLLLLLGSSGLGGGTGAEVPGVGGQPGGPQSGLSSILPLILLLDSGSDNMVLLLYIFGFLTAVPEPLIAG